MNELSVLTLKRYMYIYSQKEVFVGRGSSLLQTIEQFIYSVSLFNLRCGTSTPFF